LNEPSVVAVKGGERGVAKKVLAVGKEAKLMLGRTPGNIVAIRPMKEGVIADFEITEAMLRYFIRKVHKRSRLVRPRIIIGVPSGITRWRKGRSVNRPSQPGQERSISLKNPWQRPSSRDARYRAQGKYGCRHRRRTTEVAVISLGGIVYSKSVRVAGDRMDEALWITSGENIISS